MTMPEPPLGWTVEILSGPHAGEKYLHRPDGTAGDVDTWAELLELAGGPECVRVIDPLELVDFTGMTDEYAAWLGEADQDGVRPIDRFAALAAMDWGDEAGGDADDGL
ncbi:MAG TPA: hypothetical protein VGX25_35315 [Actinophytocola sp.]|uniref:hypothetical protein n=1 Tax=Actinophytocola sp. TaxID=1872138 RepID=UPI002DDCCD79|nr:hypothetical protein [Actinophytocola sp.]HEV2784684.1 hypothetical protein [Actinophytocola sp.]